MRWNEKLIFNTQINKPKQYIAKPKKRKGIVVITSDTMHCHGLFAYVACYLQMLPSKQAKGSCPEKKSCTKYIFL